MKMYEPKLNINDTVWVMSNNRPIEKTVVEIEIIYRKDSDVEIAFFVKYTLTGGHVLYESTPHSPGDFIFRTKKELLDYLYENS